MRFLFHPRRSMRPPARLRGRNRDFQRQSRARRPALYNNKMCAQELSNN